ncbi:MAG: hypothetical protein IT328_23365 [Caldilineaceae bacterium]|nr:hypothetical protein [Caldilineaceae bacterium]
MHFSEESALTADSERFHHRLQAQSEQQAQELAWLLEQRMWMGDKRPRRPPEALWSRLHQWMARHLAPRLNLQHQLSRWSLDFRVSPVPPTEDAIEVIEVEYWVQDFVTQPPGVTPRAKEGLP